jgi:hypothetical protein
MGQKGQGWKSSSDKSTGEQAICQSFGMCAYQKVADDVFAH